MEERAKACASLRRISILLCFRSHLLSILMVVHVGVWREGKYPMYIRPFELLPMNFGCNWITGFNMGVIIYIYPQQYTQIRWLTYKNHLQQIPINFAKKLRCGHEILVLGVQLLTWDPHVYIATSICRKLLAFILNHLQTVLVNFINILRCEQDIFNFRTQLLMWTTHQFIQRSHDSDVILSHFK